MTPGVPLDGAETAKVRRVERVTCSGCPARWTARNAAHCGACHELFASIALFDAHRSQDGDRGACIPPAEVQGRHGERRLFFRDGMWRGPEMPDEAREAFRRLAS